MERVVLIDGARTQQAAMERTLDSWGFKTLCCPVLSELFVLSSRGIQTRCLVIFCDRNADEYFRLIGTLRKTRFQTIPIMLVSAVVTDEQAAFCQADPLTYCMTLEDEALMQDVLQER